MNQLLFLYLHRFIVGGIALVVGLTACRTEPLFPAVESGDVRQQQTVGKLLITLDSAQIPLINQPQQLLITLTNQWGAPINNADVYLDLSMNMLCLNGDKPIAETIGRGRYVVNTVYPMAGNWEITIFATVDAAEHQVTFRTVVQD